MDADTKTRIDGILDHAGERDLVVVASIAPSGGAAIHTLNPDAGRLVNLASSLLDQALDLLREEGADDGDLGALLALAPQQQGGSA